MQFKSALTTLLILSLLGNGLTGQSTDDEFRTWNTADGKYSVVAKYVETADQKVKLLRKDTGKTIEVPLRLLSGDDRRFIKRLTDRSKPKTGSPAKSTSKPIASKMSDAEWLTWRGPNLNGHAPQSEKPPVEWSSDKNIVWKTPIPGRGHSSPIIYGDKIFLTTADQSKQQQLVLCYERATGKEVWSQVIHRGNLPGKIHQKNTHASPTIACDKESLFAYFNNGRSIFLTKLDLAGKIAWQKKMGDYDPKYPFGFAPSPALFNDKVIVTAESKIGFMAAVDKKSGDIEWRIDRKKSSYSSPVIAEVAGKKQILLSGGNSVSGFDPNSGRQNWTAPAIWDVSCGTLVWGDGLVFSSGGYPRPQTLCVKADGSGQIVWQNNVKCYEQSMLYHDGYLYGISDNGVGYCWKGDDGKEMWRARMEGPVSSSPTLANGNIYYASESGTTFVFKATPTAYEAVAKNKLGDSAFATPAFCDNKIYTRVGTFAGRKLQEYLICIGE